MKSRRTLVVLVLTAAAGFAALYLRGPAKPVYESTSFITSDNRVISAIRFPGRKDHAVVYVHGFGYTKETWIPIAGALQAKGLPGLAFDFRGRGESAQQAGGDPFQDVIAAVRQLQSEGHTRISLVGSDRGAKWILHALPELSDAPIESVVLLSPHKDEDIMSGDIRKLFVVAAGDRQFYNTTTGMFNRSAEPKAMYEYRGKAHGEEMFYDSGRRDLVKEIVAFVTR